MPTWDPTRYLQFADDRARPFLDLIAQIPTKPSMIVDLGCGPGHLTRHLRAQWPSAQILGIDSSAEMIDRAIRDNTDSFANYDVADADEFTASERTDLIVSNAMLHWLPDQFAVLDRLLSQVSDGAAVAIQVPNNSTQPSHRCIYELAESDRYAEHLASVRRLPSIGPADYLDFFTDRGYSVNAWETTYFHMLHGADPVYEWISGTALRPFKQALPEELRGDFVEELKESLRQAYPAGKSGTVLPFRRTFAVATAGTPGA